MTRGSSLEDESALARRGLLSETEERELDRELEANPVLRAAHAVGVDLDRSTAVRAGDEELISRAADAALARVVRSGLGLKGASDGAAVSRIGASPKRRRTVAILLSAALVLVTGVAAAVFSGVVPARWLGRSEEKSAPASNGARSPRARGASPKRPPAELAPSPDRAPVEADALPDPEAVSEPRANAAGIVASRPPPSRAPIASAATMFSAANTARRDGDFERAKRAYSDLIARYPSSDEARLARVSLGKLLLAKGNASDAEREFDQYLKGGHGQLAEEALVSRAESLKKLGRAEAEALTWQRLLAEHPNSVYSAEARGRLDTLRRGGAPPAP